MKLQKTLKITAAVLALTMLTACGEKEEESPYDMYGDYADEVQSVFEENDFADDFENAMKDNDKKDKSEDENAPIEVDLFEGVEVYDVIFDSYSSGLQCASVTIDYVGDENFKKFDVRYSQDKYDGIVNGDTIKVTAEYDEEELKANNMVIVGDTTKDFVIEGYDEYVYQPFDDTEIQKVMEERIDKIFNGSDDFKLYKEFVIGNATKATNVFSEDSFTNYSNYYIINGYTAEFVAASHFYDSFENKTVYIYKVNFDVEKTEGGFSDDDDGVAIGTTLKSDDMYLVFVQNKILKKADGTIGFDMAAPVQLQYQYSISKPGSSFEEIYIEEIEDIMDYTDYKVLFSKTASEEYVIPAEYATDIVW